jgi:hypothetical protein
MESISIRNKKLNYYVITYSFNEIENVYFIVSTSETTAVNFFLSQNAAANVSVGKEDILNVSEIGMMNPN